MTSAVMTLGADLEKAIAMRDLELLSTHYAASAKIHSLNGIVFGPEGLRALGQKWRDAFEGFFVKPLFREKTGQVHMIHWKATGKHTQEIADIPPSGKNVCFHGFTCFREENGQIVEHWATIDYKAIVLGIGED